MAKYLSRGSHFLASRSTNMNSQSREKDLEIRDLKEKVVKLEMEKAELIHSTGYRSSSKLEDMDTSKSEYLDDFDDDDWVLESEEKEKPVKKRICRTSIASNPFSI
ncbi:hypothetical protein CFP56_012410 [Quercus suber]|uniref:Uncharacterized protein n=1 Tax=Quercus suber TaxID=58331 RepID=A0AAW0J4D1_QUESU